MDPSRAPTLRFEASTSSCPSPWKTRAPWPEIMYVVLFPFLQDYILTADGQRENIPCMAPNVVVVGYYRHWRRAAFENPKTRQFGPSPGVLGQTFGCEHNLHWNSHIVHGFSALLPRPANASPDPLSCFSILRLHSNHGR